MPTPKTTPPAAEKLLPCPFCGGEARIEGMLQPGMAGAGELMGYQAMCQHCYVSTDGPVPKIEAIQQWNTRPQSSPDAPPAQRGVSEATLEWLRKAKRGMLVGNKFPEFAAEILAALAHKEERE